MYPGETNVGVPTELRRRRQLLTLILARGEILREPNHKLNCCASRTFRSSLTVKTEHPASFRRACKHCARAQPSHTHTHTHVAHTSSDMLYAVSVIKDTLIGDLSPAEHLRARRFKHDGLAGACA